MNKREQRTILKYDKLIIATGAVSDRPALKGFALPGVFTLRWIDNGLKRISKNTGKYISLL
jgi:NAD(P)H-nitrite reductase large subunit